MMNAEMIIGLLAGAVFGFVLGYFILKTTLLKDYILKSIADSIQAENNSLKIQLAQSFTKEDIARDYVHRELYNILNQTCNGANAEAGKLKELINIKDAMILNLTAESENRITKEELEERFVPKSSYTFVANRLKESDSEMAGKDKLILDLNNQITVIRKDEESLAEKLRYFTAEVETLQSQNREQFKNLANEILKEKSKDFAETNKVSMDALLNPLKTDITTFKKTIEDSRKEEIKDITSLKTEIESLQKLNVQLSDDAQKLAHALRSDFKIQGNWGEDRLLQILETEGLQRYTDFLSQGTYQDVEDNIKRPDFIMKLPDNKHLVIDCKVSINAYIEYFNAENPEIKKQHLKQLVRNILDHIEMLAGKEYQSLSGLNTPDFVMMFMPFESALTLAMNENPEIFNRALRKKIILITPTTFVATAKVIKLLWQNENRVRNVEEIFKQCGMLYDKFAGFTEEMVKLGNGLHLAQKTYKDAMNKLSEGSRRGDTIIGKFEKIKELDARTTKALPGQILAKIDILGEAMEHKVLEGSTFDETETIDSDESI
jgi:DNA recombination protein RmuC